MTRQRHVRRIMSAVMFLMVMLIMIRIPSVTDEQEHIIQRFKEKYGQQRDLGVEKTRDLYNQLVRDLAVDVEDLQLGIEETCDLAKTKFVERVSVRQYARSRGSLALHKYLTFLDEFRPSGEDFEDKLGRKIRQVSDDLSDDEKRFEACKMVIQSSSRTNRDYNAASKASWVPFVDSTCWLLDQILVLLVRD